MDAVEDLGMPETIADTADHQTLLQTKSCTLAATYNPFSRMPAPPDLSSHEKIIAAFFKLSYSHLENKQPNLLPHIMSVIESWQINDAQRIHLLHESTESKELNETLLQLHGAEGMQLPLPLPPRLANLLTSIMSPEYNPGFLKQARTFISQPETSEITEYLSSLLEQETDAINHQALVLLNSINWNIDIYSLVQTAHSAYKLTQPGTEDLLVKTWTQLTESHPHLRLSPTALFRQKKFHTNTATDAPLTDAQHADSLHTNQKATPQPQSTDLPTLAYNPFNLSEIPSNLSTQDSVPSAFFRLYHAHIMGNSPNLVPQIADAILSWIHSAYTQSDSTTTPPSIHHAQHTQIIDLIQTLRTPPLEQTVQEALNILLNTNWNIKTPLLAMTVFYAKQLMSETRYSPDFALTQLEKINPDLNLQKSIYKLREKSQSRTTARLAKKMPRFKLLSAEAIPEHLSPEEKVLATLFHEEHSRPGVQNIYDIMMSWRLYVSERDEALAQIVDLLVAVQKTAQVVATPHTIWELDKTDQLALPDPQILKVLQTLDPTNIDGYHALHPLVSSAFAQQVSTLHNTILRLDEAIQLVPSDPQTLQNCLFLLDKNNINNLCEQLPLICQEFTEKVATLRSTITELNEFVQLAPNNPQILKILLTLDPTNLDNLRAQLPLLFILLVEENATKVPDALHSALTQESDPWMQQAISDLLSIEWALVHETLLSPCMATNVLGELTLEGTLRYLSTIESQYYNIDTPSLMKFLLKRLKDTPIENSI